MPPFKSPPSYPPAVHYKPISLAPSTAQTLLAAYVKSSERNPYLHPTSLLSSSGITHGPNSGPTGGLAMHHLRRIEAGLRGESLIAETNEELRARFGQSEFEDGGRMMSAALSNGESTMEVAKGDDTQLDAVAIAGSPEDNKDPRHKGMNGDKKRKRNADDIYAWVEESSRAGSPADASQGLIMGEVGDRDPASVSKQPAALPVVNGHHHDDEAGSPRKKARTADEAADRNAAKKARKKAERRAKHLAAATS